MGKYAIQIESRGDLDTYLKEKLGFNLFINQGGEVQAGDALRHETRYTLRIMAINDLEMGGKEVIVANKRLTELEIASLCTGNPADVIVEPTDYVKPSVKARSIHDQIKEHKAKANHPRASMHDDKGLTKVQFKTVKAYITLPVSDIVKIVNSRRIKAYALTIENAKVIPLFHGETITIFDVCEQTDGDLIIDDINEIVFS